MSIVNPGPNVLDRMRELASEAAAPAPSPSKDAIRKEFEELQAEIDRVTNLKNFSGESQSVPVISRKYDFKESFETWVMRCFDFVKTSMAGRMTGKDYRHLQKDGAGFWKEVCERHLGGGIEIRYPSSEGLITNRLQYTLSNLGREEPTGDLSNIIEEGEKLCGINPYRVVFLMLTDPCF